MSTPSRAKPRTAAKPVGIRQTPIGWRAFFKFRGRVYSKRFPPETALSVMKDWIGDEKARLRLGPRTAGADHGLAGAFEQDVIAYLQTATSMPSYSDRVRDLKLWAAVFRGRNKETLTPLEIRTQLEKWRRTRSASTCNKRRTALMSFFTRLNGKSGYNPVRDVEKYPEEEEIRAQTPMTIYRVLTFMRPSKTRVRLRVILWTGWPHAQLKRLRPEHLDLTHSRAYVTPRRKGKGRAGKWLPLLPQAVVALREFAQWDCFTPTVRGTPQPFSHHSMHARFLEAVGKLNTHRKRLGLPPVSIRPYDIRHTFLTWLAERLRDERALQEIALHSRIEQTRRYTERATQGRVDAAIREVAMATFRGSERVSAGVGGIPKHAKTLNKTGAPGRL